MHARQIKERIGVFIAVPGAIEALVIALKVEQRRERRKQFVTARMFGGMSRCFDEIDDSGDCHRRRMKSELIPCPLLPVSPGAFPVPAVIAGAGEKASEHFLEFVAATICHSKTRAAYVLRDKPDYRATALKLLKRIVFE
jgi:hypothetical protein